MSSLVKVVRFLHRFIRSDKSFKMVLKIVLYPIRSLLYRHLSFHSYVSLRSRIGRRESLSISSGVRIAPFSNVFGDVILGRNIEINPFVSIYGKVNIGDNTLIAPGVVIVGGNYIIADKNRPMKEQGATEKGIVIGKNCWIGANSIILDGVTLGDNSIVAAGTTLVRGEYAGGKIYKNKIVMDSCER